MVERDPWIAEFYARLCNPPPQLVVLSGPSGAGKDSLLHRMKELGVPFHFVVTATTRPPRPGEVDGVDYHFVSRERFQEMIARGELLEHALVYGDYKGIPRKQVEEALRGGKDVILRLDVQGAATIRKLAPEAILIFLTAPSEEDLVRRLRTRKTEDPEALARRIATAREELRRVEEFDYVVVNREGCLDEAVDQVQAIIQAEKCRVHPRRVVL
ncbi:MAG: guanylate kinase [Anaerolineae bacterium]|nr:guanylate kinase [Anaerolineae bacterium]